MNKQELIEKYEKLEGVCKDPGAEIARLIFLEDLRELDEPQKVQVPQSVAEWIEKGKKELSLRDLMSSSYTSTEVGNWLGELDEDGGFKNQETFARAVLDGYTVEKEKRYRVKMKGFDDKHSLLKYGEFSETWYFDDTETNVCIRKYHTRKQIEEAGFGEVFNSPLFEVEEVEG